MGHRGSVDIAECPEHGLHGARDTCFVCGKPVRQRRMVALDELCDAIQEQLSADEHDRLDGSLGEAIADESGSYGLEFTGPEDLAKGIVAWLKDWLGDDS